MDLFDDQRGDVAMGPGAMILGGFALDVADRLLDAMAKVTAQSPFRHMTTSGGHTMSVAMTNCGPLGWVSDHTGYRYDPVDPTAQAPWPPMPNLWRDLAIRAAAAAGFEGFQPDACLINRYAPGSRLSLHQDRNERNMGAPIVSVSLGVPATFLWGGMSRSQRPRKIRLCHGDVAVWGGESRLAFHGIGDLPADDHPATGQLRYNLTFRHAG